MKEFHIPLAELAGKAQHVSMPVGMPLAYINGRKPPGGNSQYLEKQENQTSSVCKSSMCTHHGVAPYIIQDEGVTGLDIVEIDNALSGGGIVVPRKEYTTALKGFAPWKSCSANS